MTAAHKTRTLADMQDVIFEQIDRLRAKELTPAIANATVNSVAIILRAAKMQMDYAKAIGKTPNIPLLLTSGEKE